MRKINELLRLIEADFERKKRIFFFFDYDGVLVPIQNNPATAYLKAKTKRKLLKLATNPLYKVAVVSGRNLSTLKKLTRIKTKKITLIGSHGLEIFHQGKKRFLSGSSVGILRKIKPKVVSLAKSKAGGFVENKPYTIAYHIRDSRKEDLVQRLSKALNELLNELKLAGQVQVLEGKNIVEIMPREITKGKAVEKIIKLYPKYLPIYFGDDVTDISAFRIVRKYKGISVSLNPHLRYKADFLISSQNKLINLIGQQLLKF